MARISYVSDDNLTAEQAEIWAYFRDVRKKKPSDTHRLMAHAPDMLRAFLGIADASQRADIPKRQRELITMMSAFLTDKEYVWAHHWDRTIAKGVTENQLRSLGEFETAECFTDNERNVLRFMKEAIAQYRVSDETWEKMRGTVSSEAAMMEFMMVVAFTCFTGYIHGPAEIDIEPKYAHVPSIASIKARGMAARKG